MFEMDYFDFENFDYDIELLLARADAYVKKANEGFELISTSNEDAMMILREINRSLEKEYNHYRLQSMRKYLIGNKLYSKYVKSIESAYVKQIKKTSYSALRSNLYDIESYMGGFQFDV